MLKDVNVKNDLTEFNIDALKGILNSHRRQPRHQHQKKEESQQAGEESQLVELT